MVYPELFKLMYGVEKGLCTYAGTFIEGFGTWCCFRRDVEDKYTFNCVEVVFLAIKSS